MIDDIDKSILRFLQQDAKMTIKEIGAQLNLSNTPIHERIKRLESDGYINSYKAILDRVKIGLTLKVYCTVSLKQHEAKAISKFEKEIQGIPEVYSCHHVTGIFDYLLEVYVEDMSSYQHFVIDKLSALANIAKVQSSFVMTEIKKGDGFVIT